MQAVTFTVVIPTLGRDTLPAALTSLARQPLLVGDEVVVVGDGHRPAAHAAFRASGMPGRYDWTEPDDQDGGGAQRNRGMALARTSHLLFLDDDDLYNPGALAAARRAVAEHPGKLLVFRMYNAVTRRFVWDRPEARLANVGTPMLCVPNDPGRLGEWGPGRESDWHFYETTAARLGPPVWREEVLATVYPHHPDAPPRDTGRAGR